METGSPGLAAGVTDKVSKINLLKIAFFWDVTPCSFVGERQHACPQFAYSRFLRQVTGSVKVQYGLLLPIL